MVAGGGTPPLLAQNVNVGKRNETGEESGAQVTSLLGSVPGFHPGDNCS